jgi:hypothetical protein
MAGAHTLHGMAERRLQASLNQPAGTQWSGGSWENTNGLHRGSQWTGGEWNDPTWQSSGPVAFGEEGTQVYRPFARPNGEDVKMGHVDLTDGTCLTPESTMIAAVVEMSRDKNV